VSSVSPLDQRALFPQLPRDELRLNISTLRMSDAKIQDLLRRRYMIK
jgi:hypothetical protein